MVVLVSTIPNSLFKVGQWNTIIQSFNNNMINSFTTLLIRFFALFRAVQRMLALSCDQATSNLDTIALECLLASKMADIFAYNKFKFVF